jgi:hypothetical protein
MDLDQARRVVALEIRAHAKYRAKRRSLLTLGRAVTAAIDEHQRRLKLLDLDSEGRLHLAEAPDTDPMLTR